MNVLFAFYGDFSSNSAVPLALHARELHSRGHRCAIAMPAGMQGARPQDPPPCPVLSHDAVLADPPAAFDDGRPADVVHAWTPREGVRRFVTRYQAQRPTPWLLYHEDNEAWIAKAALAMVGIPEPVLLQHSEEVLSTWTPQGMPHPLRFHAFIGLADAAVVIQRKLGVDVPPWVPCTEVMPGTDLALFTPRPADVALRRRYGVSDAEKVIVYPGGLNDFTRPGLEVLCRAVGLVNERGIPCRLLRSGPVPLDFLDRLPQAAAAAVTDLGPLDREALPPLLALADVFVQPGKHDPFEDLRLPGKLPELFAMGRPVVLPDTNIAHLLQDGLDAVIHRTGTAEEIAEKCLSLFADAARARRIGEAGRRFAETHFDPAAQAARLEGAYRSACEGFDAALAARVWTADAEREPVSLLLARKLRMLAATPRAHDVPAPAMLEAHAARLECEVERARGLEKGMAVRDEHIARLEGELQARRDEIRSLEQGVADREGHIAALESSLSWRLTRPLRMMAERLLRLTSRSRP